MPVSHTVTDAPAEGSEPFELLRRLELLRSLDDATLEAVMEGVEPVRLQEGQVLVRQGELDDALADDLRFPPSGIPSEWRIFWNKLLPFARPVPVPSLAAIVMRTLLLASANRTALVERDADLVLKPPLDAYGLLEFKKIHAIAEVGYRYTLEAASRWSGPRGVG